ncbi:MAG TPA: tripartite tricarboxylate transporter TctB family protein [Burkholderiales bacterium]|nr:tripartite tricarboxylate transporter TctB family protein [Burkholderiales bacterium]
MKPRAPLGADLVIPALALGFASYFFHSIAELPWEAKANGALIGAILVLLIALQLVRMARQLARGEGDLRADSLWRPADVTAKRLGMIAVTAAFIATLPWAGLTLGLFCAMLAALAVMGVRRPAPLLGLPLAVAAAAYLLFIVALQSDFPHGPIEKLLS